MHLSLKTLDHLDHYGTQLFLILLVKRKTGTMMRTPRAGQQTFMQLTL